MPASWQVKCEKKARHKAGLRSEERLFEFVTPHSMRGLFGFENGYRLRGRYDSLRNQSCNSHKRWLSQCFGMVIVGNKHLPQCVGCWLEIVAATTQNLFNRIKKQKTQYWVLNPNHWTLTSPENRQIKLTHSELTLSSCFAKNSGNVVSKQEIIESIGHSVEYYDMRRLEILIRRFRHKAKNVLGYDLPIETVHGKGYAFSAPIKFDERIQRNG